MFDYLLLKGAILWLCVLPAALVTHFLDNGADRIALYASAVGAAIYLWTKVIRPFVSGINKINDAYHLTYKTAAKVDELAQDVKEIKEKL